MRIFLSVFAIVFAACLLPSALSRVVFLVALYGFCGAIGAFITQNAVPRLVRAATRRAYPNAALRLRRWPLWRRLLSHIMSFVLANPVVGMLWLWHDDGLQRRILLARLAAGALRARGLGENHLEGALNILAMWCAYYGAP